MPGSKSNLSFLGFKITTLSVESVVALGLCSNNLTVNCFNAHSYAVQKRNLRFANALKRSDVLIPDGSGVELFSKAIANKRVTKISGNDLFIETLVQLNCVSGTVFLLGSSTFVLERMVERASNEFPNVKVRFLSPPYKNEFSQVDLDGFIESVEKCSPDVIFIGMTAPKQEIVIDNLGPIQGVKFLAGVGAVFDFYAETISRPNIVWIGLHLEWLGRFLQQPRKLWRRVFISMPIFLWDILLHIIKSYATKQTRH